MWYKEWRLVRYKLVLWLLGFGFLTLAYLSQFLFFRRFEMLIYPGNGQDNYTTLFENWLKEIWNYLPILAILGGIDLISEEVGHHSISFLLSKPISRCRIYLSKISLNSLIFGGAIGLWSLVVLVIDRLPRSVDSQKWTVVKEGAEVYGGILGNGVTTSHPAELFPAFFSIVLMVLLGSTITAMFGLISIFTRSVIQTLLFSVLPLGALLFGFYELGKYINIPPEVMVGGKISFVPIEEVPLVAGIVEGRLIGIGIVTVLAGILVGVGLFFFQRKEF